MNVSFTYAIAKAAYCNQFRKRMVFGLKQLSVIVLKDQ